MEELFKELITAYTPKEVTNILKKIGASKMLWENVGKRRNNLATINIGTDPAAGVTERITNAIDAVLEKEWITKESLKVFVLQEKRLKIGLELKMEKYLQSNQQGIKKLKPYLKKYK